MTLGLVDELLIYTAPKFLGQGRSAFALPESKNLNDLTTWHVLSSEKIGQDVRTILVRKEA